MGMEANDRIEALLQDLLDSQREHLAEYRKVTQQSLEMQQRSIARQEAFAALYRRMVVIGGTVAMALLVLLIYLLVRWSGYLFR